MFIISSFEYSTYLELAISELENKGIKKENILAVPLNKKSYKMSVFDPIDQSDGVSLIDLAVILGTIFMLFGTIYGFILTWGPIIWGLIGLIIGLFVGFIIKYAILKRKLKINLVKTKSTEVFLAINCNENQKEMVEEILWSHYAIGVGILND